MPSGFIAIANDCMGNFFCYRLSDCRGPESEAPIWFFDHDFVEVERIFDNLEQWLGSYAAL